MVRYISNFLTHKKGFLMFSTCLLCLSLCVPLTGYFVLRVRLKWYTIQKKSYFKTKWCRGKCERCSNHSYESFFYFMTFSFCEKFIWTFVVTLIFKYVYKLHFHIVKNETFRKNNLYIISCLKKVPNHLKHV